MRMVNLRFCAVMLVWLVTFHLANGQTQDVQEGPLPGLTAEEVGGMLKLTRTMVKRTDFPFANASLRKTLERLYDVLEKRGVECPVLVDTEGIAKVRAGDVYAAEVRLADLPDEFTVGEFLRAMLSQVAGEHGEILWSSHYFELTTKEAANRHRATNGRGIWDVLQGTNYPRTISLDALERSPWRLYGILAGALVLAAALAAWTCWRKNNKHCLAIRVTTEDFR